MSILGFISDRSLIDSSRSTVNLETLNLPCGFLDRQTIEYFVTPLEVPDKRTTRLPIDYRRETGTAQPDTDVLQDTLGDIFSEGMNHLIINPTETVTSAEYDGLDYLDFTTDVLPGIVSVDPTRDMLFTIDNAQLTADEAAALAGMTQLEQERLFNVIEYLMYGTITPDTISDIDSFLSGGTAFLGYVMNSVRVSTRTVVKMFGGVNVHRAAPKVIEFKFTLGSRTVTLRLWFDTESFLGEYPITTILAVVPPFDLNTLINPSALADPIDSAILSKAWSDAILKPEMAIHDETGMYLLATRYVFNTKNYDIVFGIVYRGKAPDSMSARNAVAAYLLASGVGTRALWEIILPDIFFHSAFAIIPFYDNITVLTNADVSPSIINALPLLDKLNSVIDRLPHANDSSREFMTAAFDRFFIGVAPSDVNEDNSLLALHPTYQDFSTTDVEFSNMSQADREWSVKLNQALSIAAGGTNILTFNRVNAGGLEWINFVLNYISYIVLTKASYKAHFNLP